MALTPEVIEEIIRAYKQTRGSPFKTARTVGVTVSEVFTVIEQHKERIAAAEERYGGMGRPEMEPFMVARRPAMAAGWNNDEPDIAQARSDYAAGTHEMATGRDGPWLILYSIPRRVPAPPRPEAFCTLVSA